MTAHKTYAFISDGIVQNVCRADNYEDANRVARCVYGDDAIAIDVTLCPCEEGDTYADKTIYGPDGTARPWLPTQEQEIELLKGENEALKAKSSELMAENQELTIAVADLIGGAE